ncbi:hypothetical protein EVAR_30114_1 [Eumeta japonica]|uniref:Uncharacterized protein n=1 Tax=Eumeta variegata TaxID=151549 RepID=A0A4C1WG36_EUMVA|nr:hypothetical protein EVAR_30114_1 [Eumeta japonica]
MQRLNASKVDEKVCRASELFVEGHIGPYLQGDHVNLLSQLQIEQLFRKCRLNPENNRDPECGRCNLSLAAPEIPVNIPWRSERGKRAHSSIFVEREKYATRNIHSWNPRDNSEVPGSNHSPERVNYCSRFKARLLRVT